MRLDELVLEYFPGGDIGNMAADNIPAAETDVENKPSEQRAKAMNNRKRSIRKRIARTRHRNRRWTQEEIWDASPKTAEHDLGQTDAALNGIMRGSNPYPGDQGI